ncbi:uncharacterized protein LOC131207499 [Anopheles bellator]|uniref:uncharacterized protein LOC131207499 n=1 Tax=Anopheles bellator TaxID=139047 RepID=UPI002649FD6B|nr:uncharacterized protein LOC131207499 [Anopheles bellator]
MNSFIQELRHLSNSSAISSISSASTDSGISTSHYGDSNVGSGLASATSNSKQQHCIGLNSNNNIHGKTSPTTGAVPKVGGIPTASVLGIPTATTIWGNKSLWGPAPFSPPLPETSALVSSSIAIKSSPALPVAAVTSPTSNALYSSVSKELYSPWTTPAATVAAATSPIASLATQQQLSALNSNTSTVLSKTTSIPTGNNTGTNIWDSKLDLFGPQQQCPASLLGSIWVTPELSTSDTTFTAHDEAHGPSASSGGAAAWGSNIMSHAIQTVSHGSTGSGGDTMNAAATSKLSTLWSNAPPIGATGGVMSGAENGSVLKSLRMGGMGGGGMMSSSDNVTSAEAVAGVSNVGRVGPSDNMGLLSSNTSPSTALFSDEIMSYLNVFN